MKSTLHALFVLFLVVMIPFRMVSQTTCPPPTNLTATSINSSGAILSWTAPAGSIAYIVQYRAASVATWTTVTTQSTSIGVTNLTCATAYQWQVAALCVNGTTVPGPYSSMAAFTTLPCNTNCVAPTALTTTNIGTGYATFSWVAPSPALNYIFQYRPLTPTGSAWITHNTQANSITITNLACGTAYEWHVATICNTTAGGTSPYSAMAYVTTSPCTSSCVTPSGLTTGGITANTATLSWTPVTGAAGYLLQYRSGGGAWINVTTQSASVTLTNLVCGTAYQWHIATVCGTASNNISLYSATIGFTTTSCSPPCIAPNSLSATNITGTSAVLSWINTTGATAYILQYRQITNPVSAWINVTVTNQNPQVTFTLNNLVCGTHYEWRVAALCSNSSGTISPYSNTANFTTASCTPPVCVAPLTIAATNITTTAATLTWSPVTGALGYLVQYHTGGGAWTTVTTQSPSITLTTFTCGTTYEWHVATICGTSATNISPYSVAGHFTTLPCTSTCVTPTNLHATNITTTTATLGWTGSPGAAAYIIQYHAITTPASPWITVTTQTTSASLTGLTCGTHYEWRVATICANGTTTPGTYSAMSNFTTPACTPPVCVAPLTMAATNIATTGATLTWSPVTGALGYLVQYHSGAGAWITITTQSPSITLTTLTCGTTYEWHVATICNTTAGGTSPYSVAGHFTTLPCTTACNAPTNPHAGSITTTAATLAWTGPTGALGYLIQYRPVTTPAAAWINITTQNPSTIFTLGNLTCGTHYEWHVATICGNSPTTNNISAYSAIAGFTTAPCTTNCVAPSNPHTVNIGTNSATFSWTGPAGGVAYLVQYRPITSAGAPWINVTAQTNSITLTNLACGTHYEWHVATICGTAVTNISPYTATVSFTTLPCNNVCPVPSGSTSSGTNSGSTTRLLTWNSTGALIYNIRYRIVNAANWITTTSNTNSKLITGLQLASHYEWQVQSVCTPATGATAVSAWSISAGFTTPVSRAVYPNPTSGTTIQVPVTAENEALINITIADRMGRIVRRVSKTIATGDDIIDINIADLESGMYFIKVRGGNNNEVQKIFISR